MTNQPDSAESAAERIVVGVDGSPDAQWAITHAQPLDSIDLVHTCGQPVMAAEVGMVIDPRYCPSLRPRWSNASCTCSKARVRIFPRSMCA